MNCGFMAVFRDLPWCGPWQVANTIIYSPPKHKALLKSIELICANVRSNYFGRNPLSPTGPDLFGKALALTCDAEEVLTGESRLLVPKLPTHLAYTFTRPGHCFIFSNKLIAVKRKTGGNSLSELGLEGTNDYVDMWRARDIYA